MITRFASFRYPGKRQKIRQLEVSGLTSNPVPMRWNSMTETSGWKRFIMTETWELLLTVLAIYLRGVLTGVVSLGVYIYLYLKPGDQITIKRSE